MSDDIKNLKLDSTIQLGTLATAIARQMENQLTAERDRTARTAKSLASRYGKLEESICDALELDLPAWVPDSDDCALEVIVGCEPSRNHPTARWFYLELCVPRSEREKPCSSRQSTTFPRGELHLPWDVSETSIRPERLAELLAAYIQHKEAQAAAYAAEGRYKDRHKMSEAARKEFTLRMVVRHMPEARDIMEQAAQRVLTSSDDGGR